MRVFVTGIGAVSAFGNSWDEMRAKFLEGKKRREIYERVGGL